MKRYCKYLEEGNCPYVDLIKSSRIKLKINPKRFDND